MAEEGFRRGVGNKGDKEPSAVYNVSTAQKLSKSLKSTDLTNRNFLLDFQSSQCCARFTIMASQQAQPAAKDQTPQQEGSSTPLEGSETITATTFKTFHEDIAYWERRLSRGPQIIKGGGIDPRAVRELLSRRFGEQCLVFVSSPSSFSFLLISVRLRLTSSGRKMMRNQYHVYADQLLTLKELQRNLGRCTLEAPTVCFQDSRV
ncbi:hypothetical protein NKR23_g4961 [Pleurostoma richardsiae]|uniref:Uncharacterized protein n=1 Tax=Pleurostoma richardsiae TaxID=41990 RepID=A0AA38RU44_9PEZI|nr:hypothetical protein NKR23_g4961 [Pleurostoma richardsiae]